MISASGRQIMVISGLAGSGKSVAIRALEDAGWYCIDNLPVALMEVFGQEMEGSLQAHTHLALALDSRDPVLPQMFSQIKKTLEAHAQTHILFLEARDEVLLSRFRETRRLHPLTFAESVSQVPMDLMDAIHTDRKLLGPIRSMASRIIDTSELSSNTLRQMVHHLAPSRAGHKDLLLKIMTFGFKYGVPADVDMVLDARCFPNPHYNLQLRPYTGQHKAVKEFVFQDKNVQDFIKKIYDLMLFLYPLYLKEGKHYFGVGIGCTGGKHRSVAIAEELVEKLTSHIPFVALEHCHMDLE